MQKAKETQISFIPARSLGALLGLSLERLRQLARQGVIPTANGGAYPLVASVQGYIRFLRDSPGRTDGAGAALADAKRRETELRNSRTAATLIETSAVEHFFVDTLSTLRAETVASIQCLDKRIAPLALAAANRAFNRAEEKVAEAIDNLRNGRDPLDDHDEN
ncbi:hypothetical protein [Brucella pseudintermedia]|uniref:hypothetical protein n=1 Tax=Brucella pseudintermedia TaxID=370111 RepID=UPI00124DC970|nr:hypothetical protein [Brucella pseudintermedia]KAB2681388.1 hypothetical protein F9K78_14560 [Brucella pseudintermedia]